MNVIVLLEKKSFAEGCFYNPPTIEIKGIYPWGPNGARAAKQTKGQLEAQHNSGTQYELIVRSTEDCANFAIPQFAVTGEFYLEFDQTKRYLGYKTSAGEYEKLHVRFSYIGDVCYSSSGLDGSDEMRFLHLYVQDEDKLLYSGSTLLPATASEDQQKEALWMIATAIRNDPENLKQVCDRMSYIHLDEFGEPTTSGVSKLIKE